MLKKQKWNQSHEVLFIPVKLFCSCFFRCVKTETGEEEVQAEVDADLMQRKTWAGV